MSGATAPSAIRIEDLTVAYDRIPAVHHLNGSFAPGSLTAIAGPNGAGKSTLLKTLVGILKPDQGRVVVSGGTAVGYLPQRSEIERSFPIRVWDMTALGLWPENGVVSAIGKDQVARIADALRAVGLENMARRPIGTLSAGQFQRVLFARLLVQDRADHPARRAVLGDRRAHDGRSAGADRALAPARAAPSSPCCTNSSRCARIFPQCAADGARAGRPGVPTGDGADRGQPACGRGRWPGMA